MQGKKNKNKKRSRDQNVRTRDKNGKEQQSVFHDVVGAIFFYSLFLLSCLIFAFSFSFLTVLACHPICKDHPPRFTHTQKKFPSPFNSSPCSLFFSIQTKRVSGKNPTKNTVRIGKLLDQRSGKKRGKPQEGKTREREEKMKKHTQKNAKKNKLANRCDFVVCFPKNKNKKRVFYFHTANP